MTMPSLTTQKIMFYIKDLLTFIEKILNEKLHFLCSVKKSSNLKKRATSQKENIEEGTSIRDQKITTEKEQL